MRPLRVSRTPRECHRQKASNSGSRQWDNKNTALFPAKIRGKYYLMHRISPTSILEFPGTCAGAPPLWTPHGWLLLYHGVDDRRTYRLGIALLDLEHPRHVLAQTTRSSIARSPTRAKGSCPMLSSPAARWNWGTASSDTTGAPTASSAWRRSSHPSAQSRENIEQKMTTVGAVRRGKKR